MHIILLFICSLHLGSGLGVIEDTEARFFEFMLESFTYL